LRWYGTTTDWTITFDGNAPSIAPIVEAKLTHHVSRAMRKLAATGSATALPSHLAFQPRARRRVAGPRPKRAPAGGRVTTSPDKSLGGSTRGSDSTARLAKQLSGVYPIGVLRFATSATGGGRPVEPGPALLTAEQVLQGMASEARGRPEAGLLSGEAVTALLLGVELGDRRLVSVADRCARLRCEVTEPQSRAARALSAKVRDGIYADREPEALTRSVFVGPLERAGKGRLGS
jgi:hypothetical protein